MKLLWIMLLSISFQALAEVPEIGCLDYDKYEAIVRRVNIYTGEKRGSLCDTDSRYYRIMESLQFMKDLELDGPAVPRPYNQSILGDDFYGRILRLSPRIDWGPSQVSVDFWGQRIATHSCANAVAYARLGNRVMYFCPSAFNSLSKSSVLFFVSTMLHETRHLEGRTGFQHVPCNGFVQGCDPSLSFRGAFAAEVEAMAKIGVTATNVHPGLKYLARRMAYETTRYYFKANPFPRLSFQSVVFLSDERGKHLAYNYRYKASAFEFMPPGDLHEIRNGEFMYVPRNKSLQLVGVSPLSYQEDPKDTGEAEGDLYLNFTLFRDATPEVRATFKGSIEIQNFSKVMNASIWGDVIKIFLKGKPVSEVKLPSGTPLIFRTIDMGGGYGRPFYFHVLNDKDQLFKIEVDRESGSTSISEVANPYPGFTYVSKVELREEYEEWESARNKWEKQKKNKGKDYPVPQPEISEYRIYLLDKEGYLHIQVGNSFPLVPELSFYKFKSMTSGGTVVPEFPSEFQADFF